MGLFSSIGKVVGKVAGAVTGGSSGGFPWGSVISAGSNIVGGLISDSSASRAQEAQVDAQREFAQNGIRWRVADAQAAGLHPLAALGAQVTPYQPFSVGESGLGRGISEMGQDISRSMHATRDRNERAAALAVETAARNENLQQSRERHSADMQRAELENMLLASQLKRQQVQSNPPFPSMTRGSVGDPNSAGSFVVNPAEITSGDPTRPERTAGPSSPAFTRYNFGGGALIDLPSQEASEALESAGPLITVPMIAYQNAIGRHLDGNQPPTHKLPPGYKWRWDSYKRTYVPVQVRSSPYGDIEHRLHR